MRSRSDCSVFAASVQHHLCVSFGERESEVSENKQQQHNTTQHQMSESADRKRELASVEIPRTVIIVLQVRERMRMCMCICARIENDERDLCPRGQERALPRNALLIMTGTGMQACVCICMYVCVRMCTGHTGNSWSAV